MSDSEQQAEQEQAEPVAEGLEPPAQDPQQQQQSDAHPEGAPEGMSKSQLKKLKRRQFYEEKKQRRKEAERQRKQAEQERRREEGRKRLEAMTEEERERYREERNQRSLERKQERVEQKARMEQALQSGQKIVIDLDFADYMTDTEQRSICQQLGYCWHANCAARTPAHLALTSLHGKMEEVMRKQISGYTNWQATVTDKPYIEHFGACKDKLVYLTADSDNELQELDPEAIYIIGGIVDRNRHKLLCYNKAEAQGIAHARLPIGDYIRLASSQVMTTNHVVDIMLRWLELRDWKAAFEAVIPNRKRKHDEGEGEEGEEGTEGGELAAEQDQREGGSPDGGGCSEPPQGEQLNVVEAAVDSSERAEPASAQA